MSKKLCKYTAAVDHFDKTLLVLSATSPSVSIASLATVTGGPVRITSGSLCLLFSIGTRIAKNFLKTTRKKKRSTIKLYYFRKVN